MIAVIADDFTGAAEMGGIGLRYGYRVILETSFSGNYDCDILICATNMRAMDEKSAMKLLQELIKKLQNLHISILFFKLDSVFRGHIKSTLKTALQLLRKSKVVFIPANPSLNRIIANDVYYYQQKPLMDSGFFPDSEHQKVSSHVFDLIGKNENDSISASTVGKKLRPGIVIGNVSSEQEMDEWASALDKDSIPAGGASFFEALLKRNREKIDSSPQSFLLKKRCLYICGSAHNYSKKAVQTALKHGAVIHYMPKKMFCVDERKALTKDWANTIISGIKEHHRVIAAINDLECNDHENLAERIENAFAELVSIIVNATEIDELIIEGGATAYAVINKLRCSTFIPVQEIAPGVIQMKIEQKDDLFITVKPGSYQWPKELWTFQ